MARRVEDISSYIQRQLGDEGLGFDYFSLACDESTDASDTVQLLILSCAIKGQTRGTDLFISVCEAVDVTKLPWTKVSDIITDGAPSMAGGRSRLSTLICNKVSKEAGDAIKLHSLIHQQALCSKHLKLML